MSTDVASEIGLPGGVVLTSLGMRLEILRIERGISKQRLARHAATSRQQLWRVMTGKSELTSSLRDRLAGALSIDPVYLSDAGAATTRTYPLQAGSMRPDGTGPEPAMLAVAEYLADARHLTTTLRTLPAGDAGRRLKRVLLNAVEDLAMDAGLPLPEQYAELRSRVLAGDL